MGERWARYKDTYINMAITPYIEVRKVDKDFATYTDVGKGNSWVVFAGHNAVCGAKKKDEAQAIAKDLVEGRYDI